MSIPRAATSVTTSMGQSPLMKDLRLCCRATLSMFPYIWVAKSPEVVSNNVRYSTWCLVAAKIRVSPRLECFPTRFFSFFFFIFLFFESSSSSSAVSGSSSAMPPVASTPFIRGSTSLTRCSSTASFSALRQVTNPILSSSLTATSESSLTTVGSCIIPVFVNSMSARGIVAENSIVCLCSGMELHICRNCIANPISKRRSASSKTTHSHCRRWKSGISLRWCARRPGVATITSGRELSRANCFSIDSPPLMPTKLKP
mmetsp:Transcript_42361/g.90116  ORF Transcript_42361/g.90116 Transcript_42361/m.90116 type:complete len:258 (-) Transcript_42361:520-1293(-)